MRKLLIVIVLIVLLFVAGWLTFRYDGREASVNLDTEAVRGDTRVLIEKGEAAVERATERGRELIEDGPQRR